MTDEHKPTTLAEAVQARLANAADERRLRAANAGTHQPAESFADAIDAHYQPAMKSVTREAPGPVKGSPE